MQGGRIAMAALALGCAAPAHAATAPGWHGPRDIPRAADVHARGVDDAGRGIEVLSARRGAPRVRTFTPAGRYRAQRTLTGPVTGTGLATVAVSAAGRVAVVWTARDGRTLLLASGTTSAPPASGAVLASSADAITDLRAAVDDAGRATVAYAAAGVVRVARTAEPGTDLLAEGAELHGVGLDADGRPTVWWTPYRDRIGVGRPLYVARAATPTAVFNPPAAFAPGIAPGLGSEVFHDASGTLTVVTPEESVGAVPVNAWRISPEGAIGRPVRMANAALASDWVAAMGRGGHLVVVYRKRDRILTRSRFGAGPRTAPRSVGRWPQRVTPALTAAVDGAGRAVIVALGRDRRLQAATSRGAGRFGAFAPLPRRDRTFCAYAVPELAASGRGFAVLNCGGSGKQRLATFRIRTRGA